MTYPTHKLLKKKLLFIALLLVPLYHSHSQTPFSEKNISYLYNPTAKYHIQHRTYYDTDSITTFLSIYRNNPGEKSFKNSLMLSANFREGYSVEEIIKRDTLKIEKLLIGSNKNWYYLKYTYPVLQDANLLEIVIKNGNSEYPFSIPLNPDLDYGYSDIAMRDTTSALPELSPFIHPDEQVMMTDMEKSANKFWVYYYDADFEIAVPPMIVDNDNVTRTLEVSKQFSIPADSSIYFEKSGLYLIQKDTSSLDGYPIRVHQKPFPKFGTYENLIKPLKYISTKEEFDRLTTASDKKAAFENHWVKITGSPENAKEKIKRFYDRVAEANLFFTGYKEGWKTDMGMVYIIYGKPEKVFRHNDYEEWLYPQNVNLPALRFTFVKIKNVFDRNHYSLVRDKKFDKHWFRAIELWRSKN